MQKDNQNSPTWISLSVLWEGAMITRLIYRGYLVQVFNFNKFKISSVVFKYKIVSKTYYGSTVLTDNFKKPALKNIYIKK